MFELLLARPEVSKVNIFRVGIDADNLASIRCFQHVGFIEEGIDEDGFLSLTYKMNNHWR